MEASSFFETLGRTTRQTEVNDPQPFERNLLRELQILKPLQCMQRSLMLGPHRCGERLLLKNLYLDFSNG